MNRQTEKIIEYDILRVLVTLLVVIGHGAYYCIVTEYGGCDYSELAFTLSFSMKVFVKLSSIIYAFHMPLFMGLSGALFFRSLQKGKYQSVGMLIQDKFRRLLIPFAVVSVFYSFPIKYVSGYYEFSENVLKDFVVGQLLLQGNTHLWFLPTLLVIFLLVYVVERFRDIPKTIKICGFLLLYLLHGKSDIALFRYVMEYGLWFYLGLCFEPYRKQLNKLIERKSFLAVDVVLFLGLYFLFKGLDLSGLIAALVYKCLAILLAVSGSAVGYATALLLSKTALMENQYMKLFLKDSFGIYLYSDSPNYLILKVATGFLGTELFMQNTWTILIWLLRVPCSILVAILISQIVRKLKWKELC